MKTGILGYKGRVVYRAAAPVNTWIDELADLPKQEFFAEMSRRMDREIHRGYQLYPNNYIAHDIRYGSTRFKAFYTEQQYDAFTRRLSKLDRYDTCDIDQLKDLFLGIYANPVEYGHTMHYA
jgi:hypothetical protein